MASTIWTGSISFGLVTIPVSLVTAEAREDRYVEIMATACVAIAIGHVRRIDRDNILQASLWGMRVAYRALEVPAAAALIDGNIESVRHKVVAAARLFLVSSMANRSASCSW